MAVYVIRLVVMRVIQGWRCRALVVLLWLVLRGDSRLCLSSVERVFERGVGAFDHPWGTNVLTYADWEHVKA